MGDVSPQTSASAPPSNASAAASASASVPAASAATARKEPASSCAKAGKLGRYRDSPSVSLLADGSVLIAGGKQSDDGSFVTDVERFDPRTKTMNTAASLHDARARQGVAVAGDGRVVVVAGRNTASVEVYDPKKDEWTKVGAFAGASVNPNVVTLASGDVLMTGGDLMWKGAFVDGAFVFDTRTSKLRPVKKLPDQHLGVYALRQADGKVAFLGINPSQVDPSPNWTQPDGLYDPANDQWTTGPVTDPAAVALRSFVSGPEKYEVHAILGSAHTSGALLVAAEKDQGKWHGVVALQKGAAPSVVLNIPPGVLPENGNWGAVMPDDHSVVVLEGQDISVCALQ